ncbi:MAG: hypothetical protein HZA29_03140 [Candidatus Omnitrophica bacterium]|nr:hypothetical protein [Candidatus Omnitrophota bacterium]
MHTRRLLGEILIDRKRITPAQLGQALGVQNKEGGYIGEILIKLGFVDEQDIIAALVVQCHLPYIAVDRYEITREVIALIPREMAFKHCIVPLDRVGDVLSLVMLDPLDVAVRTDVCRRTNCKVAPFISTRREIERAIDQSYGKNC